MSKTPLASRQGIEAASRTYNRCTELLRKELGMETAAASGHSPRDAFEETVTLLRARIERRRNQKADLTEKDFSFNEVVRLMRLTANKVGTPKKRRIKRGDFIRLVNETIQVEGGLKTVRRWHDGAKTGRYAWIDRHMSAFLRSHADLVRRSAKYSGELWVGRKNVKDSAHSKI